MDLPAPYLGYPLEREFEAWIIEQIDRRLTSMGVAHALFAVSPHVEVKWPADQVSSSAESSSACNSSVQTQMEPDQMTSAAYGGNSVVQQISVPWSRSSLRFTIACRPSLMVVFDGEHWIIVSPGVRSPLSPPSRGTTTRVQGRLAMLRGRQCVGESCSSRS